MSAMLQTSLNNNNNNPIYIALTILQTEVTVNIAACNYKTCTIYYLKAISDKTVPTNSFC